MALRELCDAQRITPVAVSTNATSEVVDLVDKPMGTIVHLRVLPGTIEQYRRLLSRVGG